MGRDEIEVLGERMEEARISRFELPPLADPDWHLPGFLRKRLKNALTSKPVLEEELCKACCSCEEICPPKALRMENEKRPVFDYGKFIRCFCCQEVCPEGAISVKPGWAVRIAKRGSRK